MCRQAGYFEQALRLAQDREKHEWYLKILLEDLSDYRQALEYIQKLPPDLVCYLDLENFSIIRLESKICQFSSIFRPKKICKNMLMHFLRNSLMRLQNFYLSCVASRTVVAK